MARESVPESVSGERRAKLVGRTTELSALDEAYALVREKGGCQVVSILGATGVGKTRLVREFLGRVAKSSPEPRVYRGEARAAGGSYDIFSSVLRARFGLVEGMNAEASALHLRGQVAEVLEDRKVGDVIFFLGQLLDLSLPTSPLIQAVEGNREELRSLRRAVLKRFFEADARGGGSPSFAPPPMTSRDGSIPPMRPRSPVVLVFDDLQWAHDDSVDLLAYLMNTLAAPILLVCVGRPEIVARRDAWHKYGEGHHRVVELGPISESDSAVVMHDLLSPCGDDPNVEDLVEAACTLAGGNPALLEQMVRIYRDMGVVEALAGSDQWQIHVDRLAEVKLPLTIEDAVQARIAALTPRERDLLERAATMGGVFWLGGLCVMLRLDERPPDFWTSGETTDVAQIRALLRDLMDRDYVLRLPDSTFAGDEEYVFKHNLERETLLKLTPPVVARRYHTAIADWLSFQGSVRSHEEYLAMLARHREQAGVLPLAATAYLEAADVARSHYANAKAAECYETGLDLIRDHGIGVEPETLIRSFHHYGDVLQSLGRNDEALVAFREMLTHSFRLDLRSKGGAAQSRIGRLHRETGKLAEAARHLGAALSLFEEAGDDRGVASTLDDIGKLHWLRGDYPRALDHTQRALTMRRKLGDRRSIALSLNNLGLVYQDSGQFKQALEAFEQALRTRREIGDLVGVSISLNNLGTVAQDQRDDARALKLFLEAYDVARETGDRNRIAVILTNIGETHSRLGDPEKAIVFLKKAEALADELGDALGLAEAVRGLGKAYLAQRDYAKARECTQRAVQILSEIQSSVQLGIALRALGEVTAAGDSSGASLRKAQEHLERSVLIFEQIGNDVELGRSLRAFADLIRGSDLKRDTGAAERAEQALKRAEEIFQRLRVSTQGLVPEAFFQRD
jgi:tetratricopeptide (TPR) repeat protein